MEVVVDLAPDKNDQLRAAVKERSLLRKTRVLVFLDAARVEVRRQVASQAREREHNKSGNRIPPEEYAVLGLRRLATT